MSSKCPVCGDDFYNKAVMRSHMSNIHPEEFEKSRDIVEVECSFCGSSFEKKEDDVCDRNFCDQACQIRWMKSDDSGFSGRGEYPDNWDVIREKALNYYGRECDVCGESRDYIAYDVHHRNRDKSDNRMSNLQVLCSSCHQKEHIS